MSIVTLHMPHQLIDIDDETRAILIVKNVQPDVMNVAISKSVPNHFCRIAAMPTGTWAILEEFMPGKEYRLISYADRILFGELPEDVKSYLLKDGPFDFSKSTNEQIVNMDIYTYEIENGNIYYWIRAARLV